MLKTTSTVSTRIPPKVADNSNFLIFEAKLTFLQLKKAFTKALMLHHFDPERYIWIEIDTSDNVISGFLSQLTQESDQ